MVVAMVGEGRGADREVAEQDQVAAIAAGRAVPGGPGGADADARVVWRESVRAGGGERADRQQQLQVPAFHAQRQLGRAAR